MQSPQCEREVRLAVYQPWLRNCCPLVEKSNPGGRAQDTSPAGSTRQMPSADTSASSTVAMGFLQPPTYIRSPTGQSAANRWSVPLFLLPRTLTATQYLPTTTPRPWSEPTSSTSSETRSCTPGGRSSVSSRTSYSLRTIRMEMLWSGIWHEPTCTTTRYPPPRQPCASPGLNLHLASAIGISTMSMQLPGKEMPL